MVRDHVSALRGVDDSCATPRLVGRSAPSRFPNNRDRRPQHQRAPKSAVPQQGSNSRSSSTTTTISTSRHPHASGEARQASDRKGPSRDAEVSAELMHPAGMVLSKSGESEEEERRVSSPREMATPPKTSPGQANAALVARGSLKSGYLWKMGANVPRWKRRYFVLKPITMLFYYMSEHDTEPRGCIDLDLFDAVRKVREVGGEQPTKRGDSSASSSPSSAPSSSSAAASTTFELYRSGCPDGSGFMLEARADEDWEHWVEAIANGRHGKMQAEMDVMKGANKLLLAEISGLEQQVATFRGYAEQRHVTVLALRDERQRNREIAAELSSQADAASAVSHMIAAGRRARRQSGNKHEDDDDDDIDEEGDARRCTSSTAPGGSSGGQSLAAGASVQPPALVEAVARTATGDALPGDKPSSPRGAVVAEQLAGSTASPSSAGAKEREEQRVEAKTVVAAEAAVGGGEGEQASLEAIRKALADAAKEWSRRRAAFEVERDARVAVQSRVKEADRLTRAAELRAEASEAAAAKVRGRVSVLERNVEYLQDQQRALRAELCQARHKAQLVRAQKAVLKKEVREMWSRNAVLSSSSSKALPPPRRSSAAPTAGGCLALPQQRHHQREPMRSRMWASMGDLAQANAASASSASDPAAAAAAAVAAAVAAGSGGGGSVGLKRRSMTSTSFADVAEEVEDEAAAAAAVDFVGGGGPGVRATVGERETRGGGRGRGSGSGARGSGGSGVFRPCLSRASLAASDEGGETDFADQTMSEASDFECDNDGNPVERSRGHSSHEAASNLFRDRVRGTIRKRVGDPQVPPLPPPRHLRVVKAVKRIPSQNVVTPKQPEFPRGANGGGGGAAPVAVAAAAATGAAAAGQGGGGGGAGAPTGGLGMAGLFHGFRKGMVDMAAQEMGKTLARWPGGGMPSVGSLASLAAGGAATGAGFNNGNMSGNFNSNGNNLQTPPGSPRSTAAGFSAALTDSPVRWGSSSSSHGSTASSEAGKSSAGREKGGGGGGGGEGGVVRALGGAAVSPPYHSVATAGLAAAAGLAAGSGGSATNLLSIVAGSGGGGGGGGGGGLSGALTRVGSVSSRTALIQVSDLELAEPCDTRVAGDSAFSAQRPGVANDIANEGVPGGNGGASEGGEDGTGGQQRNGGVGVGGLAASTPKNRRTTAPRPAEECYELLFSTQVIGLQFRELAGGGGVCVQGMSGYVGPTPTGFPGERLSPGIGDVLESYNGVSAKGKSADVVARELARCGRPLRLGFRSVHSELTEGEEEEEEVGGGEAEREGGGGGWACEGSKVGEEGRSCRGRPPVPMQRVGSPWAGAQEQQQLLRGVGGASSCRDDVALASPAHPWTVSS